MVIHIVKVEKQQYEIYKCMVKMGMVGGTIWQEIKTRLYTALDIFERLCLETLSPDTRVGDT